MSIRDFTDRAEVWLAGALVAIAALAWTVSGERMAGMDAGPGTDPGSLGFFIGIWVAMMAAMMFPSVAPVVVMYNRTEEGGRALGTTVFVIGYLVAWTAAGLVGYGIFELGRATAGDLFSWDGAGPYLAGGILVAAAFYQLTRVKDACLSRCRAPLEFLIGHRTDGLARALWIGIIHGGWCIGCCWALMASLFALGIMSLPWMVFIAALITVERLMPWRQVANRGVAILLVGLGLMVALAPSAVPGLTIPGTSAPMQMPGMEAGG